MLSTIQSPAIATPVAKKPVGYFEPTTKTLPELSSTLKLHQIHPQESLPHSGSESSKEIQLNSTKSLCHSTILSLMKRERATWETQRSLLASLKPRNGFQPLLNGPQHGEGLQKPSLLPSPIGETNFSITGNTSSLSSWLSSPPLITNSSSLTLPCATKSQPVNKSSSQIILDSTISTRPLSCLTKSKHTQKNLVTENLENPTKILENPNLAINSTLEPVRTPIPSASIDTYAKTAIKPVMERRTVQTGTNEIFGLQPKYLHHNLWEEGCLLSPTTAEWSEEAHPLPRPPLLEISELNISKTIADNPHLFQVKTPIKIDIFESMLKFHPNPIFVTSVCDGLCEGFWPWADTSIGIYPEIHDESHHTPSNEEHATFIQEQCLKEQHKGYFSQYSGTELLPGMYSMPIHAVPKPHSKDLRLVNNHSAGPFSLNSMIDHTQVTGFPLDNLCHLVEMLLDIRQSIGNVHLPLWKLDISDAYWLLPMNPYWQAKQIITVDGERYIDRNLSFGSSGSLGIFISFNSLVAWIAKYIKGIDYLANYVDDSSGCNLQGDTLFYEPYNQHLLTNQTKLLLLWDELGIPHKPHKQVFGCTLVIMDIEVNPNRMSLTLPAPAKERLIDELKFWTAKPPKSSSGSFKLKYWQA